MSAAAPGLAEILAGEALLYERLLAVLAEEEQALRGGRLPLVAECVTRKENLVLEIRLAELARQAAQLDPVEALRYE